MLSMANGLKVAGHTSLEVHALGLPHAILHVTADLTLFRGRWCENGAAPFLCLSPQIPESTCSTTSSFLTLDNDIGGRQAGRSSRSSSIGRRTGPCKRAWTVDISFLERLMENHWMDVARPSSDLCIAPVAELNTCHRRKDCQLRLDFAAAQQRARNAHHRPITLCTLFPAATSPFRRDGGYTEELAVGINTWARIRRHHASAAFR
jgi:hypothetical protein